MDSRIRGANVVTPQSCIVGDDSVDEDSVLLYLGYYDWDHVMLWAFWFRLFSLFLFVYIIFVSYITIVMYMTMSHVTLL
jgi:hypothetical protein